MPKPYTAPFHCRSSTTHSKPSTLYPNTQIPSRRLLCPNADSALW